MKLELETISPVKIGTGEVQEIDRFNSAIIGYKLIVLNTKKIFREILDYKDIKSRLGKESIQELVPDEILNDEDYWKYSVPIQDPDTKEIFKRNNEVDPHILLPNNLVYLPGSSLKGALRTRLLYQYYVNNPSDWWYSRGNIERNPEKHFRLGQDNPKRDILKTIRVTDSNGIKPSKAGLIVPIRTSTIERGGYFNLKPWKELHFTIAPNKNFEFKIEVEEEKLRKMEDRWGNGDVKEMLGGYSEQDVLERLFEASNKMTIDRIERDLELFSSMKNKKELSKVIDSLEKIKESLNQAKTDFCIINIGFGVGRLGTTIQLAAKDKDVRKQLRGNYGRNWQRDLNRYFPKTRKLYTGSEEPMGELGWVKLERLK
ncbi:type III-A CRISPR-associated RAMP protein Csm5 [Methanonatronarchaeum sp. AMET-Sl]|uniref:type III-A CRISPR-associated RAMP protein Csm5 n=1 Tax=Methanonatronarchaeum sp. AMET-Sl TaxID=3037654 RepID=UPI00244DA8C4|nr:type III-A CRISPR-associated RAMP protein Csm5 [Methanonatronarchaeum sp. AMET-Sl]WGI17160.1 type III-A CRISPR-associated RAMP protein Csm5 [Methanonatronarchaeum sp. AMET-Sl]